MPYRFGDVVIVPFPFTDQSAIKKRPAVIVNWERYGRERPDVILMAVTSQVRSAPTVGDVAVRDWQTAGLLKPSVIKPIIATVEARIVHRQLGRLHADDQAALRQILVDVLG